MNVAGIFAAPSRYLMHQSGPLRKNEAILRFFYPSSFVIFVPFWSEFFLRSSSSSVKSASSVDKNFHALIRPSSEKQGDFQHFSLPWQGMRMSAPPFTTRSVSEAHSRIANRHYTMHQLGHLRKSKAFSQTFYPFPSLSSVPFHSKLSPPGFA